MKLLTIALFMALFVVGYSWESIGYGYTDPAHPGKCVVDGLVLSPGEESTPKGHCVRILCGTAEGQTTTQGCGITTAMPPCIVGKVKYPNKAYPKCCEMEIICPEGKPKVISRTG